MKKIVIVGMFMMVMLMSLAMASVADNAIRFHIPEHGVAYSSADNYTIYYAGDNNIILIDNKYNINQNTAQEQVEFVQQIRTQEQLNCSSCDYKFEDVYNDGELTKRVMVQEQKSSFLGMAVTIRDKFVLNSFNVVTKHTKNIFSYMKQLGLIKQVLDSEVKYE